jgi:multiple sugar transport system ATP-binding protein
VVATDAQRVDMIAHGLPCSARVVAADVAPGEPVTLGIRPEHVVLGQGPHNARVVHVERLGELSQIYLELPGASAPLLAKTQHENITLGGRLPFDWPAEHLHVFRADGSALPRPPR